MLRSPCPCSLLCLLLAGCGGGGGGGSPPPSANEARFQLLGGELPAGQEQLAVTIRCDQVPTSAGPVLFEAVLDPGPAFAIATTRAPLQAIRPQPTVDGDIVAGTYKVVYGDGRNKDAQALAAGEWFQVWLQVKSPRPTGPARVTLRDLHLVDGNGATVAIAATPVFTDVTIR